MFLHNVILKPQIISTCSTRWGTRHRSCATGALFFSGWGKNEVRWGHRVFILLHGGRFF